jgi:glycosyltransferase involved in cell wall biosynthesis
MKRPLRVLHLVSSGGFFGAERVILNLASQQKDGAVISCVGAINNKHNPHLEVIREAENDGLKTAVFDSCSQADLRTIFSLRNFLKKNNIDILHTHNYKSDITGFLATRLTKVKWVATMHGWISTDSKLRWYESLDRFVLKFAGKVICVSQNNYDRLLNIGIDKDSLAVIANGIDLEQFSRAGSNQNMRKSLGLDTHDIVIAIVGRLGEEKGHKVLFKALSLITPQYPDLKCLVVGDGPLMKELQEQTNSLNLSHHIIFTGNRKDVADIYKICDILVNASFTEGLPMTILEAMASKVTVIATRVGALPQVIRNEENGILLEPGNPDTLSQAILGVLKDVNKRKALAQQAYKDVCEHYSEQGMAEKYKDLYQGVIA